MLCRTAFGVAPSATLQAESGARVPRRAVPGNTARRVARCTSSARRAKGCHSGRSPKAYGGVKPFHIAGTILTVGQKVEYGAVVPHIHRWHRPFVGHIRFNPRHPLAQRAEPALRAPERRSRDVEDE